MDDFDVYLLNTVGKPLMRHPDFYIGLPSQLTAIVACKIHYSHAFAFGSLHCRNDAGRVATGTKGQQRISLLTQSFYKTGKDVLVTIIVAYTGEMAWVRNGSAANAWRCSR